MIVTEIFLVTVVPVPASDKVTATVKLPDTVGCPLIIPVDVFRVMPAGSDPTPEAGTDHVLTPVVPVDCSVEL